MGHPRSLNITNAEIGPPSLGGAYTGVGAKLPKRFATSVSDASDAREPTWRWMPEDERVARVPCTGRPYEADTPAGARDRNRVRQNRKGESEGNARDE